MASGTATTAPSTATTAPSTAPLPLVAGPNTVESIVPIGAQLGAQDTPSINQGARPAISTEQTMQSTQRYGTLPYVSGSPYTAPLPYAAMPAMLARPSYPMGYYGQGNQFPLMPNPIWMSVRDQMLQHQLLQERQQFEAWRASQAQPQPQPPISPLGLPIKVDDDVESTTRDYPRGTCTATRPSQASPKRAQDRPAPAQDLEAFKADMTCCQTCFNPSLVFASQFKPSSGGQGESVSTQNVASVHEESPSDQEDQSEGIPQSLCLNVFGGLRRIRRIRSLTLKPMMFLITSRTRPVITQVVVQAQSTRSR